MAVDLDIDVSDLDEVTRLFLAAGDRALDHLELAGIESGLLLEREVKERTPVGVHGAAGLRGSVNSKSVRFGLERVETAVGTPLPYAVPVETGSRPHFPPLLPIQDWVESKLGLSPEEARGVAFAIARKISKHGTEGKFMFRDAFADNLDQVKAIHIKHAEAGLASLETGA